MHSAEMLDLCDEMGFYVYSECFDKWHSGLYGRYFDQDWRQDLDAMVLRDRNRPCILIWGVGNEVENQGQASMVKTLGMLTAGAKAGQDNGEVFRTHESKKMYREGFPNGFRLCYNRKRETNGPEKSVIQ